MDNQDLAHALSAPETFTPAQFQALAERFEDAKLWALADEAHRAPSRGRVEELAERGRLSRYLSPEIIKLDALGDDDDPEQLDEDDFEELMGWREMELREILDERGFTLEITVREGCDRIYLVRHGWRWLWVQAFAGVWAAWRLDF